MVQEPNELRGQEAALRVNQFRFSVELFRRNYEELVTFLDYFAAPAVAFSYSPVDQKWLWQEGMKETGHLLHNFVASALSLVDHTRVLHRQLYEPEGAIPEYQTEVDSRFVDDPLSQFVIKLRQMAQHYRLPSIGSTTKVSNIRDGIAGSVQISLRRTDLRKFDGWTAPANKFLDSAGDEIDLRTVVSEYYEHVDAFQAWFAQRQREVHGVLPDVYQHVLTHGFKAGPRSELRDLEAGIAKLEAKPTKELTFGDLEDAFRPVHSIIDQRRLMLCRHDSRLWVGKAIAATKTRFNVPSELEKRILALVSGS